MNGRPTAWYWASTILILAVVWNDRLAQAATTPEAAAAPAPWSGNYHRVGPALAALTLSRTGTGIVTVTIVAGGMPRGGATSADCTVRAKGRPSGEALEAMVTPFDANGTTVTAADLKAAPSRVHVQLNGEHLKVESDFNGCAMGTPLDGDYAPGGPRAELTPNSPVVLTPFDITRTGMGGVSANATVAAIHAKFAAAGLLATPEKDELRIEIVGAGLAFGVAQAATAFPSKLSWEILDPSSRVTFLEATSPRFITVNRVHVGMTLGDASRRLGPARIVQDGRRSWAHFPLESPDYPVIYGVTRGSPPKIDAIRMRAATSAK